MMPTPVAIWIDPGCPWAWQTAVWLRRLSDAGRVEPCERQGESLVALALARREGGNDAFERLYVPLGRRLHDEKLEMSPALVRKAAAEAGMPDIVDRAIDMPDLPDELRRAYQDARDLSAFGVPTLQIDDTKVMYGPVIAFAPEGEEAERLWEHTLWLAERPDFFELKRWPRDIRPGETAPGTVAGIG